VGIKFWKDGTQSHFAWPLAHKHKTRALGTEWGFYATDPQQFVNLFMNNQLHHRYYKKYRFFMGVSLRMVMECSAICATPAYPSNLATSLARNWLTHSSKVSVAGESLLSLLTARDPAMWEGKSSLTGVLSLGYPSALLHCSLPCSGALHFSGCSYALMHCSALDTLVLCSISGPVGL